MNGSNVDTEHRTLTADGCFAQCEDLEDVEAVNFPWPDPAKYIDPELCKQLVDEAPDDKVVMGMLWACHFQDTCAAFGMQTCLMNIPYSFPRDPRRQVASWEISFINSTSA